ncbi:MAG TPA: hypothetical protein VIV11_13600 [Kofleriaceae bacterium]
MRLIRCVPFVLLIACGDNKGNDDPDGGPRPDAAPDAAIPLTCAYTEMADVLNDDVSAGNGMAEETMLTFSGPTMICGKLDNTHYVMARQLVDIDSYVVTVTAAQGAMLTFSAPGAEAFDSVFIEITGTSVGPAVFGQFVGDHAVTSAILPPDDYIITVQSFDAVAPASALGYKLTLLPDVASRCAKSTAAATFTEANDGAEASGNDVMEVRYGNQQPRRALTALTTDAPEPTGITAEANMTYHLAGVNTMPAVPPASWADSFQDRDSYLVTAGTNQMAVRLNWAATTADFDLFIFPADSVNSVIETAVSWENLNMEDEFTTFAVEPTKRYWIFAGADDASTGQPINYDLTICGETFTQP